MAKRKQILHLAGDELAIILPVDYWRHVVSVYETLADECSDSYERDSWLNVATHIRNCIEENVVDDWYED